MKSNNSEQQSIGIFNSLPKSDVLQHHDSMQSAYYDFMGKLYGQKLTAHDLNLILTDDDRLLYLLGLSLEDILNEEESAIIERLINSQIVMSYLCKSFRLIKLIAKSNLMINKVLQSKIAMTELVNSEIAMNFMKNNATSIGLLKTSKAISKILMEIVGLNPESINNMDDIVNSVQIMNFIGNSKIATKAILNSEIAIGKYIARLANLNSTEFQDINAIISSEIAMDAVGASKTAMIAIANSEVAIGKYIIKLVHLRPDEFQNMNVIANSEIAMNAIATSTIGMKVIASSKIAMNAINSSELALEILYKHAEKITYQSDSLSGEVLVGGHLLVRIKCTRGSDYDGNYMKIDHNDFITSENFNTGEGRKYYTYQLIDNQLRLINESLLTFSHCTFEFAYYKIN